jgi:hypothetical protein
MAKRRRTSAATRRQQTAARAAGTRARGNTSTAKRAGSTRRAKTSGTVVTIRTLIANRLIEDRLSPSAPIVQLAQEWSYLLRSRARWVDHKDVRLSLRERALNDLEQLGFSRTFIRRLATVNHIEVELHPVHDEDAAATAIYEAAAGFPWEYLLSAATRGAGRYQRILITRLMRNDREAIIPPPPGRVLFVESAPGRLYDQYDFESERKRIAAAVRARQEIMPDGKRSDPVHFTTPRELTAADASPREIRFALTETVRDLKRTVQSEPFEAIHVSGVDAHQASSALPGFYDALQEKPLLWNRIADAEGRVQDGMIMRESNVSELAVSFRELAAVLVDRKRPPNLVTLNLYHSGARMARELVAQGARAAIGFLDEIDDELAELFFQAFYWAWCRPGGDCSIPQAFVEAWKHLHGFGDQLHGTGIAMWLGRSVFDLHTLGTLAEAAEEAPDAAAEDRTRRQDRTPVRELLSVEIEAPGEINYSLLHNQRPLLGKLTLTKLVNEPLENIGVTVELNLGAENYPFRCTLLQLEEPQLAMATMVQIPLTASLPRSLRERVHSTVYVKVTCNGRIARESTRRVTLIPVDEWIDDTDNNPWLPSFVLPRDPAILKIIQSSRRYLIGIRDDPAAGFDGYQSVDSRADDPSEGVDAQVRAIWTALVNEFRFQYINPPPSYSEQSQRLRTPSDILASGSGTCIDLTLLLASCLEYIDIYPVLVLLTGHAFVGYWRSEERHAAFLEMRRLPANIPAPGDPAARAAAVPFVDQYGWRLTRLQYDEIMTHIASGDLVMLEATYLTSASSFADAVEEGRANMRSKRQFDSLLDIRSARSATPPVTPLPIINDG